MVLGLTGNLDLEASLTFGEYFTATDVGPVYTWGQDSIVELDVGYDGNYYANVGGENWKPTTTYDPQFGEVLAPISAFAGPAIGLCAGLNTLGVYLLPACLEAVHRSN